MIATMVHNLLRNPGDPSYFERGLITGGSVKPEFREVALKHLNTNFQDAIDHLDRWWESKEEEFSEPTGSRYGLHAFFYEELPLDNETKAVALAAAT